MTMQGWSRMYERYLPQFLPETIMEVDEGSLQTNTSKAQLGDILQSNAQCSISFAHICGQIALVIIDLVKTWTSCSLLSNLNRHMSSRYRNSLEKLWPCRNFDPCQCVLFQCDICSQWDQASQKWGSCLGVKGSSNHSPLDIGKSWILKQEE